MSRLLSLAEAVNVFSSMPAEKQIPSLHPEYVKVDSLRDSRLKPTFWLYSDASFKCLRSFHVVDTPLQNGQIVKDIESAYGYGGVICSSSDPLLSEKAHQDFCSWSQKESLVAEFCRIHPLLANQQYFFSKKQQNRDVVQILLSSDFFSGYRKKRRWTIKKELKKNIRLVCAKNCSEISLFRFLYRETMMRAGASDFYFFTDKYFEHLFLLDSVKLWLIFYDNLPLAAAVVLESEASGIVEYHLGAYVASSKHQPMETLLHLVAAHYSNNHYLYFYLGGGRSVEEGDSLLAFKRGFSKNILAFDIGYSIFDDMKYNDLMTVTKCTSKPAKILFYRD